MSKPDQAQSYGQALMLPPAEPDQRSWQRGGVGEVVHARAEPGACEVAHHEQIGREQGDRDQPPSLASGRVSDKRAEQERQPLKTKPSPWYPDHRAVRGAKPQRFGGRAVTSLLSPFKNRNTAPVVTSGLCDWG